MSRDLVTFFQIDETVADSVVGFELRRELGRPTVLEIEVRFTEDITPDSSLGHTAYLSFGFGAETPHEMVGIVESVTIVGSPVVGARAVSRSGSMHEVRFRVVSQMALLEGTVNAQIFQELDVKEIVTKVLEQHGIAADRQRWQTTTSYEKREYCVQYFESSLAFVSRLLEEEGIYFYSVAEEGKEIIVFADDSPSGDPIEEKAEIPFRGLLGGATKEDSIFAMRERALVRSGKFTLRDYDFKRPSLDMTAEAEAKADTNLERYDYPGLYVEPSVGKRLAQVRLEAEQVDRETIEVLVESPRLHAGKLFTITDPPLDDMGGDKCVVAVTHAFGRHAGLLFNQFSVKPAERDENDAKKGGIYIASAKLIAKDVKFRTAQTTPRPVIHGPQTAKVVAPEGSLAEAICTDKHGRVKVKFHWDLGPATDDKASCWIRTSQLQTSGSMILPRIGWEVVVEYLEGNPDRPLVTGKLYNGSFMPLYKLPEGKTRTSMQTCSTPGGGGSNEIRLEDRAGGEEIFINAQYDQTVATANNKKKTVANNATRNVKVDESITVGANQTVKVTMGAETGVGGNQTISVGGNRNTEVNAVTALNASGNSSTTVGGNHFEMDGNPLAALLSIATEYAIEKAQAAASAQLEKVNAAVQSKVDQVMAPINQMQAQMGQIGAGMQAVANGDMGAIAGMAANAAGLPLPPGFGGSPAGAGGGGGGEGGAGAGEGGGEGGGEQSYTQQLGIDSAVNQAIADGGHRAQNALASALGIDGGGGGGKSEDNLDGPAGDVAGIDKTDRAKGPGHSLHKIGADLNESTGSLRIQAAITGICTDIGGDVTETVSLAKVTGTFGAINEECDSKTSQALGEIVFVKGDESENCGGNATNMVGGLVYDKVKGGQSVEGGGPTTMIGLFHTIEAKTKITLKCGASEVVIDGSGITITSPIVAVLAPKIQLTKSVSQV